MPFGSAALRLLLAFSEATIGLGLVALLIAYLPTMFTAFTEREAFVSMLEIRAGNPPSAVEMIKRMHRIRGLDELSEVWPKWENWFVNLEQTHTSLIHLVFFPMWGSRGLSLPGLFWRPLR
jgi:hypothetical protein